MAQYIIIGNGVAGVRAAETIRKKEAKAKIIMISDEPVPFYYRPQLADYISGKIGEERLWGKPRDFYDKLGIDLRLGEKVAEIVPKRNQIVLENGKTLRYDNLLIATGGKAEINKLPGYNLDSVVVLKSYEDAKKIKEKAEEAETAVVVGESLLGLEIVRALRERGLKVFYLIRGSQFWPEVLDEEAAEIVENHLRAKGVELRKGEEIKEILGSDGKVRMVVTTKDEMISCQLVGIGLGLVPDIEFLKGSDLETDKGVLVDDHLRTNVPNIYAAGDAAQPFDVVYKEPRVHLGWLKAWQQGAIAGANMVGEERTYQGETASIHTQIYGMDFILVGIPKASERTYHEKIGDFSEMGVYKKLVLKEGKIVGALFLGNVSEAGVIENLIRKEADISELKEDLQRQMFDIHYIKAVVLGVLCPVCKLEVRLTEGAKEGDIITCPVCGVDLKLVRLPNGLLGSVPA